MHGHLPRAENQQGPVDLWACTGRANQQWQPRNGTLVNPVSGKCLDDPAFATTDGTQLEIYTATAAPTSNGNCPDPARQLRSDPLISRGSGLSASHCDPEVRGYDLRMHDPVPIDKSAFGPVPGSPPAGQPL